MTVKYKEKLNPLLRIFTYIMQTPPLFGFLHNPPPRYSPVPRTPNSLSPDIKNLIIVSEFLIYPVLLGEELKQADSGRK
jgi:hypothetical protein